MLCFSIVGLGKDLICCFRHAAFCFYSLEHMEISKLQTLTLKRKYMFGFSQLLLSLILSARSRMQNIFIYWYCDSLSYQNLSNWMQTSSLVFSILPETAFITHYNVVHGYSTKSFIWVVFQISTVREISGHNIAFH